MKYFLHDTNAFDDEKITELFIHFGYEGLGLFYTILEKLGKQEKPIKTEVLKAQLRVGKKLNNCWKFMEKIDLISTNNGETFNKQLLNFSEKYKIKKEKTREKVFQWRKNQQDKENVTSYKDECNTPKVKVYNSKEKEKEKEEKKPSKSVDFLDQIIQCFVEEHGDYKILNHGKEKSAASKILQQYKKDFPKHTSEETLEGLRFFFNQCLNISDPWLYDNMSLSIIVSKYNEIIKILKNGKSKKHNGASTKEIAGITAKHYGENHLQRLSREYD